jgi:hypothetical protein
MPGVAASHPLRLLRVVPMRPCTPLLRCAHSTRAAAAAVAVP